MQENEVELCTEKCEGCIYGSTVYARTTACLYSIIEGKARGCKISECDKFKRGEKIKPRITREYVLWWECEVYDDNDIRQGNL